MYYRSSSSIIIPCLSGSPSVHLFSALSSYMHQHIKLKIKIWRSLGFFNAFLLEKYYIIIAFSNVNDGRIMHRLQCSGIFVGVMPLLELRILEIHSFPHLSLTCFDISSWNFVYDFVLLYYRLSLSVVNLRQFLLELWPFWNLEYWKYTAFRTFLLHFFALFSYMLRHIELKFCIWVCFTVLQIKFECRQFPSISVGVMPFWN